MQRFSRRAFICNTAIGLPALGLVPSLLAKDKDDLGWMDLSCQGSRYYETPNLDRLAAQGMRFTNAYAACAVCSPTRAAVQTGRYPGRLGVTDWIRSRFQGGTIPADKKNPIGFTGGKRKSIDVATLG